MEPPVSPLFPVTAWTLVRRVQCGEAAPSAEQALNSLCRTYWEPVRKYLRALGCPEEDTADVTQEFFASFLRSGGFDRANPEIGKLRTFIKHSAARYLQNHWRHQLAQRRGGGRKPEPLDALPDLPATDGALAAQSYDLDWARTVLHRALTALEHSYANRGRGHIFAAVKSGLLRPGGVEDTAQVAHSLGVSDNQVRLAVHRARQRLATALRAEVEPTVENPDEADAEVRYLLGVLAHAE